MRVKRVGNFKLFSHFKNHKFIRESHSFRISNTVENRRESQTHVDGVGPEPNNRIFRHSDSGLRERSLSSENGQTTSFHHLVINWSLYWTFTGAKWRIFRILFRRLL